MASNIIYKSSNREFHQINIGEFFAHGGQLHLKLNESSAFNLHTKKQVTYNEWEDVIDPKVTITVEM